MKKIFSIILLFVVFEIVKAHATLVLYMVRAEPGGRVAYTSFDCVGNTALLMCRGSGPLHCLAIDEALQLCPGAAIVFYDPGAVNDRVRDIIDGFYAPLPVNSGTSTETYYSTPTQSQLVTFTWAPTTVAGEPGIQIQIDASE